MSDLTERLREIHAPSPRHGQDPVCDGHARSSHEWPCDEWNAADRIAELEAENVDVLLLNAELHDRVRWERQQRDEQADRIAELEAALKMEQDTSNNLQQLVWDLETELRDEENRRALEADQ